MNLAQKLQVAKAAKAKLNQAPQGMPQMPGMPMVTPAKKKGGK